MLTEQQRLKLIEQRAEISRKWLNWLFQLAKRNANTMFFFMGWTATVATWGVIGGINVPLSVLCSDRSSICYTARFWGEKKVLSDLKKPQCTQTSKGLMCLIKPAPAKKSTPVPPPTIKKQR